MIKTLIEKLKALRIYAVMQRLFCVFGFHKNYKWNPYPNVYPECKVNRCKCCDHYEWR